MKALLRQLQRPKLELTEPRAWYNGKKVKGEVVGITEWRGKKRWKVRFEDNFVTYCSKEKLKKWTQPPADGTNS